MGDCDLVIEAIIENLDDKAAAYAALEAVVGDARDLRVEHVVALHHGAGGADEAAGPVRRAALLQSGAADEAGRGRARRSTTRTRRYQALMAFSRSIGKEPITAPDKPGFIVNRLLVPYLLDAIRCYERGLGTIEDIDNGMKLGCGYPMGPLTLLDFVGLDTTYYIANIMFDEYKDPMFAAPPLLKRMVLAGKTGRKAGEGFYKYLTNRYG